MPKYSASAGTAQVAVTNTSTETALYSYTIPANTAKAGSTYQLIVGGTIDNKATSGTLVIALRHGGVAGTSVASCTIVSQAGSGTNQPWFANLLITFRTTGTSGTAVCVGELRSEFSTTSAAIGGTSATTDTTIDKDLVVTAKWTTADPANICRAEIGVGQIATP